MHRFEPTICRYMPRQRKLTRLSKYRFAAVIGLLLVAFGLASELQAAFPALGAALPAMCESDFAAESSEVDSESELEPLAFGHLVALPRPDLPQVTQQQPRLALLWHPSCDPTSRLLRGPPSPLL